MLPDYPLDNAVQAAERLQIESLTNVGWFPFSPPRACHSLKSGGMTRQLPALVSDVDLLLALHFAVARLSEKQPRPLEAGDA